MLMAGAVCCPLAMLARGGAMAQQMPPPAVQASANSSLPQPEVSNLQGLNDYLDNNGEPVEIAQLGIRARNGSATLDDGEKISGVAVVEVLRKGAAANALASHEASHMLIRGALLGAGVASAVLFPPALIGVAMLANSHMGMSYDLVVGVDGSRVRNTMDFMQCMSEIQAGDTVYLEVIRGGRRLQVPVHIR